MNQTLIGNPKLIEATKNKMLAEQKFEEEWRTFWMGEVPLLSNERFWQMMPIFQEEIDQFVFGLKRSNGMEQAGNEVARKTVTCESGRHKIPYS